MKKAGYATNPKYSQILINLIEKYDLQDYSLMALGKMKYDSPSAKNDATDNNGKAIYASDTEKKETAQSDVIEKKSIYPSGEFKINETRVGYSKE